MNKIWKIIADFSIIGAPFVGLAATVLDRFSVALSDDLREVAIAMVVLGLYSFYIPIRFGSAVTPEEPK